MTTTSKWLDIATEMNKPLPTGTYPGRLRKIEPVDFPTVSDDGSLIGRFVWAFKVKHEGGARTVYGETSSVVEPGSVAMRWVEGLTGRRLHPDEPLDLTEMAGRPAMVTIAVLGEDNIVEQVSPVGRWQDEVDVVFVAGDHETNVGLVAAGYDYGNWYPDRFPVEVRIRRGEEIGEVHCDLINGASKMGVNPGALYGGHLISTWVSEWTETEAWSPNAYDTIVDRLTESGIYERSELRLWFVREHRHTRV